MYIYIYIRYKKNKFMEKSNIIRAKRYDFIEWNNMLSRMTSIDPF